MKKSLLIVLSLSIALGSVAYLLAQQPPPPRMHHVVEKGELEPLPATASPPAENQVTIKVEGDDRVIVANGIPNHKTGQFPNPGNPNRITVQSHEYLVDRAATALAVAVAPNLEVPDAEDRHDRGKFFPTSFKNLWVYRRNKRSNSLFCSKWSTPSLPRS